MGSSKLRSIRTWLIRNGRALDVARWYYHFEDGSAQDVLKALAAYQNPDGGFGHGLEPDIRSSASSPIQTWAATQILQEIGLPEMSAQMVEHLLDYLESTLAGDRWAATMPAMNDFPHAPWWHYSPENEFWGWNPTVELAAFILVAGSHRTSLAEKAETIVRVALKQLMEADFVPSPHELANFAKATEMLYDTRGDLLPAEVVQRLQQLIQSTVTSDQAMYLSDEYITTPTFFLNSPRSLYYPSIQSTADFFTTHLENNVTEEGYWNISWTWGEEPVHPDSLRDWRGSLILENMIYLQNFKNKFDTTY